MIVCTTCGHENQAGSLFCNGCGASLATTPTPREERKVVTVVFADLVGSTARAEALDPEDVRAILAPYHERLRHDLERHGGTVEKFIGDAVVGVFGAPVSHEDDPERAVRAGLAIFESIAELNAETPRLELEVRVGVNTGEALVALDARSEAGEAMVSGDVINTAARLQAAAPPDGILVGEQTFRATERAIDYAEHEPFGARGKAEPVRCWRVLGRRASFGLEDELTGRAPLVGREREVSVLADALERVSRDERPQLVTLVGVPGIGKSRLVQELRDIVEAAPDLITWRRGRSLPYGDGVALWALGEIVKAQAGILESDTAVVAAEKVARAVRDLLPEPAEAAWVERHLGALVGIAGGEGQPVRSEAFAARRRFLEALAERGPAVLVFEDVHWADDDLLDFIDELTERLDAVPLLLVCTARPELLSRRPGWGGGKLNAVTLSLAPLSADETTRLVHGLLDRSVLPAETQAAILERAAGVPLFAEELVRMLEDGRPDAELPETLHGIVTARIDGLTAGEKTVLQDAAVLGKVFWTDALSTLTGLDAEALEATLRTLERREFVRRERRSAVEGARQYVFLHALVRDAAYGQIPRAVRSAKHRVTGDWIMQLPSDRAEDRAETLAHHLESAIAFGEAAGLDVDDLRPATVAALRDAGDRAWALSVLLRALRFYRRALDTSPDGNPDPELLFLHGRAVFWSEGIGGDTDPTVDLQAAIDGLAARDQRDHAALAAVTLYRYRWNHGEPRPDLLDRAVELVADAALTPVKAEALSHLATLLAISGRGDEALPLGEEAVAIASASGDRAAEAVALNSFGVALNVVGRSDEATVSVTRALELALESGSVDGPRCYINLASLAWQRGQLERVSELHRAGLALAERMESLSYRDWLLRERPVVAYHLGEWDEALSGARECLAASATRGEPHLLDIALMLIEAAVELAREGVLLDAQVEEALVRARAVGDAQTLEPALAEAALLLADAGEVGRASSLLDELTGETGTQNHATSLTALAWSILRDDPVPEHLIGNGGAWDDAARLVSAGDDVAAGDLLASIGARTIEAHVRLLAAERLAEPDAAGALGQLELASGFWRSVGATARLAGIDSIRARLRATAS